MQIYILFDMSQCFARNKCNVCCLWCILLIHSYIAMIKLCNGLFVIINRRIYGLIQTVGMLAAADFWNYNVKCLNGPM